MTTPPLATHRRVLVVDDEPAIGYVIALQLHEEGIDTYITTSTEDALDFANVCTPALLIVDYHMPRIDGLSLARQISDNCRTDIPAILITGRVHQLDQTTLDRANISIVLNKPFSPKQLAAAVVRMLSEHPSARAGAAA